MQLIAPVTDYIPASILTTLGDIPVRGAVLPERLAGAIADLYLKSQGVGALPIYEALHLENTGVYIEEGSRNTAGAETFNGVGFQPSAIIFLAVDDTGGNLNWSVGFSTPASDHCIAMRANGTIVSQYNIYCIMINRDGANLISGTVVAWNADGFNISWAENGACVVDYTFLCLP